MAPRRVLAGCVIALALIGWSRPACGVVRLDYTVPKIYKTSNAVVVGTVAAVNPGNRVVDINVTATLKGASPGPRLRVQAAAPPDLFQKVAVGQSVVLFLAKDRGASVAIVHLADTWLLAKGLPGASKPAWRVTMPYRAARAFPGRTPSLVRLVRAIAAGANASQTESYPDAFLGGVRKLAELRVTPTDMAVLDLTDDGQPDLLVFTETGVCLFAARGSAYVDVTQASGLASAKGGRGATGDIDADGKTDLLLGRTLWRKGKSGFIQAGAPLDLPAPSTWAAAALDDATGDGRGDVVVLLKTGTLLTLANPAGRGGGWNKSARRLWEGHTARAAAFSRDWADDGALHVLVVGKQDITRYGAGGKPGPPADFRRLTGVPESSFAALRAPVVLAAPLDYDGNGKDDLLVVTETGGVTLINRGFGAFLPNAQVHARLTAAPSPLALEAGAVAAAAKRLPGQPKPQNLLILTRTGALFEAAQIAR